MSGSFRKYAKLPHAPQSITVRQPHSAPIQHQHSPTQIFSPAHLLDLQRTIGNRGTRALLAQSIQRLPTRSDITQQAREPKKNFGFTVPLIKKKITLREMSTTYRSVLDAVDAYHDELKSKSGMILPTTKNNVAGQLKNKLTAIAQACLNYLEKHPEDDRSVTIKQVHRHALEESKLVDQVAQSESFHMRGWRQVIQELQIVVVGQINLSDEANSGVTNQEKRQFHGTSSSLLNNFGGEMMTGKELENRGIVPKSGEGDFYSRGGGGSKSFFSTGEGLPGMGTAMAYAKAVTISPDYNIALFTDNDLQNQITQLTLILMNWNEEMNQVKKDDIMGARKEKSQFEGLLKKYRAEMMLRNKLPNNHPRREGKPYSDSAYPIMFEMDSTDLNVINPRPEFDLQRDNNTRLGGRALGGERMIQNPSIDLRVKGRLKRVFCPLDKVTAVQTRLTNILGHSAFGVVAFEMMSDMPEVVGDVEFQTLELMQTQYAPMRRMVLHAYEGGMVNNEPVTGDTLTEAAQEIEIIKAVVNGANSVEEILEVQSIKFSSQPMQRIERFMKKIGATTIAEIVPKARQLGLVPDKW